mgnify:CR=1 FL=1|tara:strand:- start:182 stop:790 length:609 start_codon:yes stop_codon:yes gene_type:complete
MFRLMFLLGCGLVCCSPAYSAVVYDETDIGSGDLSNDPNAPKALGALNVGVSEIIGVIESIDDGFVVVPDPDIFTFSVAAGRQLDSIFINFGTGSNHFVGIDDGPTSDSGNGTQLLVATLWSNTDNNVNLLDLTTAQQTFNGSGVTAPLGPGDYTVWVQENSEGGWDYSTLVTISATAVPEPSGILLAAVPLFVWTRRRRRK